jgi:hypothetical protein
LLSQRLTTSHRNDNTMNDNTSLHRYKPSMYHLYVVLKVRRYIWTGATFAITAAGAIYGAGLKTSRDAALHAQKREATLEEQIAALETQRGQLVAKGIGIDRKIQAIEARGMSADRE